jgi:cullin-associated NEDD8-dissociated protein 1
MTSRVQTLLKEATDYDPDKRYMAANDLCNELLKENSGIDTATEANICNTFLKQLDDISIDVQGNAVRCIKRIVPRLNDSHIRSVVDKLVQCLLRGKEEFRDIYATCLKGLISDVPDSCTSILTETMLPALQQGIHPSSPAIEECVDIMTDLLRRFGHLLYGSGDRSGLVNVITGLLNHDRLTLRKKVTQCIGALAVILPQKQLQTLMGTLLDKISRGGSKRDVYTYIQALCAISRTVGHKLGSYLDQIIRLLFPLCDTSRLSLDSPEIDIDHELIELSLTTFESLIKRCPRDIADHTEHIFNLVIDLVSYDPNYSYGMEVEEEDEDWGSDLEEEEFSDAGGDDSSWKVRRAAVHVLEAIIKSRPESLSDFYANLVDRLVDRFKERDENVKLDIFSTFSALIKSILIGDIQGITQEDVMPTLVRTRSSASVLHDQVPLIITGVMKELRSKSIKTRQGITTFLLDMSLSLPEKLVEHLPELLPELEKNMQDKSNSNLRLDTYMMLRRMFRAANRLDIFQQTLRAITPHIQAAISDSYFKITAEGLRVAGNMVKALPNNSELVLSLFPQILDRLAMTDIDQEVKQAAIFAASITIALAGNKLKSDYLSQALNLINERLRNEVTRFNSLKAWSRIAQGSATPNISNSNELNSGITEMIQLLSKSSRALRLSTLDTLVSIVKRFEISQQPADQLLESIGQFISEADLHLAQNALDLMASLLDKGQRLPHTSLVQNMQKMQALAKSPLVQGNALNKLCDAYSALLRHNVSDERDLTSSLLADLSGVHRHGLESVSRCVAAVVLNGSKSFSADFLTECQNKLKVSEAEAQVAALCIGEIGKHSDLPTRSQIAKSLIALFDSRNEDTKICASVALGNLAVGNVEANLPTLFNQFSVKEHQYLLLISLKEVISYHFSRMAPYLENILPLLLEHCENPEESVRNMVSECLGKLYIACPSELSSRMEQCITAGSTLTRATVTNSLKYAASGKGALADPLERMIAPLISATQDRDINVKRYALLSLNSIAHNHPSLIRNYVPELMPVIYAETFVKPELIRKVDLGPFTHQIDDGLPLRKAAYGLIETLLENIPEKVEPNTLAENLVRVLDDPSEEVQMLAHQVACKLAGWAGGAILGALDAIVEAIQKSIQKQLKLLSNKQEVERAMDVIRSCLRAIDTIGRIPDSESNMKFVELMSHINGDQQLSSVMQAIKNQRESLFS